MRRWLLAAGSVSISPDTQQLGKSGPGPRLALGVFVPLSHSDLRTWFLA